MSVPLVKEFTTLTRRKAAGPRAHSTDTRLGTGPVGVKRVLAQGLVAGKHDHGWGRSGGCEYRRRGMKLREDNVRRTADELLAHERA